MAGPIAGIAPQQLPLNNSASRPAIASEDQLRNQQTASQESVNSQNIALQQDAAPAATQESNADSQQNLNSFDFESLSSLSSEDTPARGSLLDTSV